MTGQDYLEKEIVWLLGLAPDQSISALVPQIIVKQLLEILQVEIEAGRVKPLTQISRSRNPRVVSTPNKKAKEPDHTELLGSDYYPDDLP